MTPREPMPVAYEDYVKAIYAHTEWQPDPITPSALAARLGLAASSVTEMVRKLARDGLVTHRPYGAVTLTDEGAGLALRMLRRHRLIETWLVGSFGYGWDEVHDEAEVLEHSLSDRLLESIAAQLNQPVRDPHGDPIPAADGSVQQPTAIRLRDAAVGHRGRVVRISDRDPELLRYFASVGLQLDVPVLVREPVAFRDDRRVTIAAGDAAAGDDAAAGGDAAEGGGVDLDLGVDAAEAVWLTA